MPLSASSPGTGPGSSPAPGADPGTARFGGLPHPPQPRSRDALRRLIEAGEALLEEHAFESAAIPQIAQRAGSSVGSFYRLVGSKDALLAAIHARFLAESHLLLERELSTARLSGREAEAVIRAFVRTLVRVYADREGLLRALIIRSSSEPGFRSGVHDLNAALEDRLSTLLAPHRDRIGHPRPGPAIRFGVMVVLGALNQDTLAGPSTARDKRALVRELSRVLTTYLALEPV